MTYGHTAFPLQIENEINALILPQPSEEKRRGLSAEPHSKKEGFAPLNPREGPFLSRGSPLNPREAIFKPEQDQKTALRV